MWKNLFRWYEGHLHLWQRAKLHVYELATWSLQILHLGHGWMQSPLSCSWAPSSCLALVGHEPAAFALQADIGLIAVFC